MKILHLSKYYHPYRGGIEKAIKELAEEAISQGHEVTVICSSENSTRSEENIAGVRVLRLPKWLTVFSQPVTPSIFWEVSSLIASHDVVHLHAPNPLFEFATLMFQHTTPLVVTFHCEVMKARALNNIYKPVSKAILDRADAIVVATQYHIEYSRWLKDYEHKCHVIPFGIRPKHAQKTMEINRQLHSIKQKFDRYFLFVGRMVPYKGVNFLLEAMKDVEQNLVLVGKGPCLETWKAMSRELGVENKVHFVGGVEGDAEFAAYLHGADALVLASINEAEAFGLVLLEAMSCKKPVITSQLNSGVRYVNIHGESGLTVPPCDAVALSAAMRELAENDELRLRLGENAYERFSRHFVISDCLNRHLGIYGQLVERKAA